MNVLSSIKCREGSVIYQGEPTIEIVESPSWFSFPLVFVVSPLLHFSSNDNTLKANTLSLPVIHLMQKHIANLMFFVSVHS